jgi:xanthine dehydrogenase small subunit
MRDRIRLRLNGNTVDVGSVAPHLTVLNWLRSEGVTSVKEGCAEGDCGSCTIMLGRPGKDGFSWRAACSCILLVPQMDGCAIVTAEGLARADGTPHPAQALMAEGGGTQCGFCSPGFVMALAALARQKERNEETLLDAISGNLCRCTGYRPILEAARALPHVAAAPDESGAAASLLEACSGPLDYAYAGGRFVAPADLESALVFRRDHPEAWILSGGTDLGLRVTKLHEEPKLILSLGRVAGLDRIEERDDGLTIGARTSYSDALPALGRLHPAFAGLIRRIGGAQIRNMGTFGGNLGNASPIGDSMPVLIAFGAEVELAAAGGRFRRVPIEDFITGYRKTVLAPDELIAAIHIPRPHSDTAFFAYKIARRVDQDISAVCAAFRLRLEAGQVVDAVAGFGGVAARPVRGIEFQTALIGKKWDLAAMEAARTAIWNDISPISDFRGSASYRRTVCANLAERLWYEVQGDVPVARLDAL